MVGSHVLIADDHPLTREGIALAARAALPGVQIDTAGSVVDAEAAIGRRGAVRYQLVLLDFVLPDARGFSGFLRLQHLLGATPIAIVSAHRDPMVVEAARALGAAGFLAKTLPLDELAAAIGSLAHGRSVYPPPQPTSGIQSVRDRVATLSGAQLKVLLALAEGKLNKQIAGALGIAEATVKAHITAIFRKLGVNNRSQALLAVQPLLGEAGQP